MPSEAKYSKAMLWHLHTCVVLGYYTYCIWFWLKVTWWHCTNSSSIACWSSSWKW